MPTLHLPSINPGEYYAGITIKDNKISHHLILLPGDNDKKMTWQAAMDAAKEAGGDLPTRSEQALLFANLKSQFEAAWYWSNEQYAPTPDSAWIQVFVIGYQDYLGKSYSARARAVRRISIGE